MSGLRNAAVLPLINSQCLILPDKPSNNIIGDCVSIIEDCSPDLIFSSPALIESLAAIKSRLAPDFFSHVECWLVTGTKVSNSLLIKLSQELGVRFESYYGLTETGGFCAGTNYNQKPIAPKQGSIGFAAGAQLEVFNEHGRRCATGEKGLLFVNSNQLMLGRFRHGKVTQEEIGEWGYATGDVVIKEPTGEIILLGRLDHQYKTPAGDAINLAYLETALQGEFDTFRFVVIHKNTRIKILAQANKSGAADAKLDDQKHTIRERFLTLAQANLGSVDIEAIESIPLNSNFKPDISRLMERFF